MDQGQRLQTTELPVTTGTLSLLFGPFRLSLVERSLQRQGTTIPLGARAFDILAVLVQQAGQIVRHEELVAQVWQGIRVSSGTPRVHLTALRKALDCRPDGTRYIANIPGRGYCFVAPVQPAPATNHDPVAADLHPGARNSEQTAVCSSRFQTNHDLQTAYGELQIAKQLLASTSTAHALISASVHADRDIDAGLRQLSEREPSAMNGSRTSLKTLPAAEREEQEMARMKLAVAAAVTLLTFLAEAGLGTARAQTAPVAVASQTHYRSEAIEDVDLFYREAGPQSAPAVVLLHGFPTSSHMFRNLIPILATRYRVIAPDYPGFGQSTAPDHKDFAYTFAHYATLVDALLQKLGVARYAMYVMDYGAPVGFRLALMHPERVTALIVQNGNAYAEGLGAFWDPIRAYWADGSDARRRALDFLIAPETTRFQYVDGVSDVSLISPDNWVLDQALLDRPGNRDIQLDLLRDYGSNVPLYPQFQAFFHAYQPPTLILWGKNDKISPVDGAGPYLRDLPKAELHLLDTGHFALEDKLDVMGPMISDFLDRSVRAS